MATSAHTLTGTEFPPHPGTLPRGEARDYGRWVDAKPLWGHRSLEENLDGVLFDYALKPRRASGAPRFPDVRIEAAYWLGLIGNGGLKRIVTVVSGANLPT
jgi:hypothetical protein